VNAIQKLLIVQEHDMRMARTQQELRDIPVRKADEVRRLDEHKQALEEAQQRRKAKQSEIKQLELDVEGRAAKIAKFRQQQFDIKTNKEFKAIEVEIEAVEREIRGFEDKELTLMEAQESLKGDVSHREKDLAAEQDAVNADIKQLDVRATELEAELSEVLAHRGLATGDVNPEWLQAYERIRHRRIDAVVRLDDGICGGCHMKLPPSAVHNVVRTDSITTCDYCGRLLY
jgi:uncharacterized protein